MCPITLALVVEMSKPPVVSYTVWEIQRSWLFSRELTECSKIGGLPWSSYSGRERDEHNAWTFAKKIY